MRELGKSTLGDSISIRGREAEKVEGFGMGVRFAKRVTDILLSSLGLLVFSPLILAAALSIKLTSRGPVLYRQRRVGRDGKVFLLYKFRSMRDGAELETGPVLAQKDDPRKTPVGRILRRLHLDEIPQLINILKGDMSMVGPRPERPIFVEEFSKRIPHYVARHKIKPGLAGWAQVHGGYMAPPEEKISYDLYYMRNWSLFFDWKIIWLMTRRTWNFRDEH